MASELKPTPLRTGDQARLRKDFTPHEARRAVLTEHGQKLLTRIRPSTALHARAPGAGLAAHGRWRLTKQVQIG